MPSIREIADHCGVSKPTVVRRLREIGMYDGYVSRSGKAFVVAQEAASAVAASLMADRQQENGSEPQNAADATLAGVYEARIAELVEDKRRLQLQLDERNAEVSKLTQQIVELSNKIAEHRKPSIWDRLLPGRRNDG